jgi:hypothetical protein
VVRHGRYIAFQMAEVAIPRHMFQEILRLIAELRPLPPPARLETPDLQAATATIGRSASECHAKNGHIRPSNDIREPAMPGMALISG